MTIFSLRPSVAWRTMTELCTPGVLLHAPRVVKHVFGRSLTATLMMAVLGSGPGSRLMQAQAATAEPTDTNAAILETLKAIQAELHDMKTLLAARSPAAQLAQAKPFVQQSVQLDLGNRPFRGDKAAPVTLIEITDYQCPFCGSYARETMPQIEREYVATGKVRYYILDLPIEQLHRDAFKAATAVRCASEQGKYWEMHDQLFANQQALSQWDARATAVGLDTARFDACLGSGKYDAEVRKDIDLTEAVGVQGTPGFYLATTEPGATKVKTIKFVRGAQPFASFKAEIEALLKHES
jgi:protein-disulfide isomerase